jgi:hypothetical protein
MKYNMISAALESAIDKDRLADCVRHYSDEKFDAFLYKFGSWVFPSASGDKLEESNRRLADVGNNRINFDVREMDDGNYVVRFSEKVFTVVLRDEYETLRERIVSEANASAAEEVILGKSGEPSEHLYIGLFGRTRLLRDIGEPEVVEMLSPKLK